MTFLFYLIMIINNKKGKMIMTRTQGPSQATLQLMQAERRYDNVVPLPRRRVRKQTPKRGADILPFTGYRTL